MTQSLQLAYTGFWRPLCSSVRGGFAGNLCIADSVLHPARCVGVVQKGPEGPHTNARRDRGDVGRT